MIISPNRTATCQFVHGLFATPEVCNLNIGDPATARKMEVPRFYKKKQQQKTLQLNYAQTKLYYLEHASYYKFETCWALLLCQSVTSSWVKHVNNKYKLLCTQLFFIYSYHREPIQELRITICLNINFLKSNT